MNSRYQELVSFQSGINLAGKKILVTGGLGFIGSNFVSLLPIPDKNIIVIDKITYAGNRANQDRKAIKVIVDDISSLTNSTVKTVSDFAPDYIINFAAETHVDNSIDNADPFYDTNVKGVAELGHLARENDAMLIQLSTDEVYGDTDLGSPYRFDEEDKLNPSNPYAATKAAADLLIQAFARTHKLRYLIVRPCNNFGPRQHNEKLIPKAIENAIRQRKIPVYADGINVREWAYVNETCYRIMHLMSKSEHIYDEIYNLGTGQRYSNLVMLEKLLGVIKANGYKTLKKPFEFVKDRPGHDMRYALNSQKFDEMARFCDIISIGATIADFNGCLNDTIDFYLKD